MSVQSFLQGRIDLVKALRESSLPVTHQDLELILTAVISACAACRWPGEGFDRKRFVESVYTRWRLVFGGSRFFAVVHTSDGQDLAELLVRAGLARIYGTRTPLSDGRDSRTYLQHLRQLEAEAKAHKLGGWGIVRP